MAAIPADAASAKCSIEGSAEWQSCIAAWDAELVRYGESITEARRRYVAQLAPIATTVARQLLDLELVLTYRAGWAANLDLRTALEASLTRDQELGATQVGPHRADLAIRLEGSGVRDRVSRGQQKLLAAVLLLSQIKLFPQDSRARPTLLLDDPAAELDSEHLTALMNEVRAQPLQLIVTTLQAGGGELGPFGSPGRRFEIERWARAGSVRRFHVEQWAWEVRREAMRRSLKAVADSADVQTR